MEKKNVKNISLSGYIETGVLKQLGENPEVCFWYSENVKMVGIYLGKICSKCGEDNCECKGFDIIKMHSYSIPDFKQKADWLNIKTLDLTKIWEKVRKVKFVQNMCFEIETGEKFYIFLNKAGYLEIKFIY